MGSWVGSIDPSIVTSELERIRQTMSNPGTSRGLDDWKHGLTETLNQHGFQDSKLFRHEYSQIMARYWNDMYMATWDEFARTVLEKPGEVSKLGNKAMKEVRNGSAIMFPKLVWVAQKA
ncbi:hypothetical protein MMC12_003133 [Toensbergia leucococca]|nr:hypothetical protein [Toensbergia leucococca]